MRTHDCAWGTLSVSSSPAPGSETSALAIPKANTRPGPSSSGYDPGFAWQFLRRVATGRLISPGRASS